MTVEASPFLSEPDARRLTHRIGLLLDAAAGTLDRLAESIREARDGRADLAMGYDSWAEYAAAEFGPHTAGLTATIRRELVATLSAEVDGSPALSTRQIAPAVGVSPRQAAYDVEAARVQSLHTSPAPTPYVPFDASAVVTAAVADATTDERPGATITTDSGVVIAEQRHIDAPAPVLGLDGKTYTRAPRAIHDPAPREGTRTNVVVQISRVLTLTEEAADAAGRITTAHLATRTEEATVWTRRLSTALESLERLNTSLQEASQ